MEKLLNFENAALDQIYTAINNGAKYGHMLKGTDIFWRVLYITRGGYIGWSHFGESANENTKEELAWILREIFETTPSEFLRTYQKEGE